MITFVLVLPGILFYNKTLLMKNFFIILLLAPALIAAGQKYNHEENDHPNFFPAEKGKKECDTRVQLADSVVNYALNNQTGDSSAVQVLKYFYDEHYNLTQVYCLSLPARSNVYHQVFTYDNHDNLVRYVNQLWKNGQWVDDLINTRSYNPEGLIIYEEFMRINSSGIFDAYQRHFYHYQGTVITDYLRQVRDANGNWYDFSHHFYVYDSMGRLTVLYGQYLNNGPVFWERTAVYGEDGRVSERYLKILRYNKEQKQNVLTNTTYQVYSYNIFNNVSEVLNHDWINSQWTHTNTDVYYYSMLKDKKVSICHNGQSICVSINALQAHLDHGDKLGTCPEENEFSGPGMKKPDTESPEKDIHFDIYPNPSADRISIRFTGDCEEYRSGVILSSDGRTLFSFQVSSQEEISFNIGNLKNGTYLVKLFKNKGVDTKTLIKK